MMGFMISHSNSGTQPRTRKESDMDDVLARDLLRVGTKLVNNQSRPASDPAAPKFHKDAWAPGVTLDSYTKREPDEGGKYVLVTEHKERIELIEQPLTPEQIAEKKEQQKVALWFSGAFAAGLVGLAGILHVLDRKSQRKVEASTNGS